MIPFTAATLLYSTQRVERDTGIYSAAGLAKAQSAGLQTKQSCGHTGHHRTDRNRYHLIGMKSLTLSKSRRTSNKGSRSVGQKRNFHLHRAGVGFDIFGWSGSSVDWSQHSSLYTLLDTLRVCHSISNHNTRLFLTSESVTPNIKKVAHRERLSQYDTKRNKFFRSHFILLSSYFSLA